MYIYISISIAHIYRCPGITILDWTIYAGAPPRTKLVLPLSVATDHL